MAFNPLPQQLMPARGIEVPNGKAPRHGPTKDVWIPTRTIPMTRTDMLLHFAGSLHLGFFFG